MKHTIIALAALVALTGPALATSSICQEQTIDGGTHQEDVFGDVTRDVVVGSVPPPEGKHFRGNDPACLPFIVPIGQNCVPDSLSTPGSSPIIVAQTSNEKIGEVTVDNPDDIQYREGDLNKIKTIIATIQNHQYTPVYDFDEWQDGSC